MEKFKQFKHELFWLSLIAIGTFFVIDAAIHDKLITLIVGLIFWYLGAMAK